MGSWVSYLIWGGDPDAPDPVSGLTKRDIHAVRKTWAIVYSDKINNGAELLRRLFKTFPHTLEFFSMIRGVPEHQYISNPQFRAHVISLMTSLNQAVDNLHDPHVVSAMMRKLGTSHSRRKIKRQHFMELKEVIVKMFVDVLNMDQVTLGSWAKVVGFWYDAIFEEIAEDAPKR